MELRLLNTEKGNIVLNDQGSYQVTTSLVVRPMSSVPSALGGCAVASASTCAPSRSMALGLHGEVCSGGTITLSHYDDGQWMKTDPTMKPEAWVPP
jgi:hypothetical protein